LIISCLFREVSKYHDIQIISHNLELEAHDSRRLGFLQHAFRNYGS